MTNTMPDSDRVLILSFLQYSKHYIARCTDPVTKKVLMVMTEKIDSGCGSVDRDEFVQHARMVAEEQWPDALIVDEA